MRDFLQTESRRTTVGQRAACRWWPYLHHPEAERGKEGDEIDVVRKTTDQQIGRCRHFIDRGISAKYVSIGHIEVRIRVPPIAKPDN
jgi:hypothetical protein